MNNVADQYQELLEKVACNCCGADDYSVIYPAQYNQAKPEEIINAFRSSGDEILIDQLVKCNKCELQYLNPRLRQEVVLEGYSSGSDEMFISQAPAREKTFSKCLDDIERFTKTRGKMLDVGTAGGSFLHVAKERGWQVEGCEPNVWLTKWSKENYGLDITPGTIFDMKLQDNEFDVVTLWDVLEHTTDPTQVLKECQRVLKPGGLLIVNYPDIGSLVSKMMGRKWVFLLSVHLYYFVPKTIKLMLDRVGFDVLKKAKHWQSLEIDYILFRMKPYIPVIPELCRKVVKLLRMQKVNIPYWVGQSIVVAKKR